MSNQTRRIGSFLKFSLFAAGGITVSLLFIKCLSISLDEESRETTETAVLSVRDLPNPYEKVRKEAEPIPRKEQVVSLQKIKPKVPIRTPKPEVAVVQKSLKPKKKSEPFIMHGPVNFKEDRKRQERPSKHDGECCFVMVGPAPDPMREKFVRDEVGCSVLLSPKKANQQVDIASNKKTVQPEPKRPKTKVEFVSVPKQSQQTERQLVNSASSSRKPRNSEKKEPLEIEIIDPVGNFDEMKSKRLMNVFAKQPVLAVAAEEEKPKEIAAEPIETPETEVKPAEEVSSPIAVSEEPEIEILDPHDHFNQSKSKRLVKEFASQPLKAVAKEEEKPKETEIAAEPIEKPETEIEPEEEVPSPIAEREEPEIEIVDPHGNFNQSKSKMLLNELAQQPLPIVEAEEVRTEVAAEVVVEAEEQASIAENEKPEEEASAPIAEREEPEIQILDPRGNFNETKTKKMIRQFAASQLDSSDVMSLAELNNFILQAAAAAIDPKPEEPVIAAPEQTEEVLATAETPKESVPEESLADAAQILDKIKEYFSKKQEPPPEKQTAYDPYPWPKRIAVRHVWGEQEKTCIPFATNFTSVEIFAAPDYRPGHMYPFLDLRGHRFDNNTYAANIGVGGRYVPSQNSGFCEMLGFNLNYDYRQGCIGYYQQVGIGIEVLGRRWDFRGNAYAPFGKRRHIHSCLFNNYVGNYFAIRRDIESVSYSFSGEVGYLIVNGSYFSLYAAAGPYFLARGRCCQSTAGIEGRIRPQYRDYVALDLSARYDDLFGTIWQMEFVFTLPLYQISKQNKRPCGLRDWQIYQPVQRFEVMPLQKRQCWETNW
ncbi:MAG: inverse autotransporter beta domain-containing protein [Parachlamydiales bacterium]|nr:inverse autotransporter beta domain-containing protein [Parachlamydiales bacterium]